MGRLEKVREVGQPYPFASKNAGLGTVILEGDKNAVHGDVAEDKNEYNGRDHHQIGLIVPFEITLETL